MVGVVTLPLLLVVAGVSLCLCCVGGGGDVVDIFVPPLFFLPCWTLQRVAHVLGALHPPLSACWNLWKHIQVEHLSYPGVD